MNFKRGGWQDRPFQLVLAIAVIMFAIMLLMEKFEFFNFIAGLLGFGGSQYATGVSIIGLNLQTGKLNYYTGEKWVDVPKDQKSLVLGRYVLNAEETLLEFSDFYIFTERRPSNLVVDANHWRYWDVSIDTSKFDRTTIVSHAKKGFAGEGDYKYSGGAGFSRVGSVSEIGETGYLDSFNSVTYDARAGLQFIIKKESSPKALQKTIEWRDQILESKSCEKFIPLTLALNSSTRSTTLFSVRKSEQYIFVDLEKPIPQGSVQRYDNSSCFDSNYVDFDRTDWKNDAVLQIYYTEKDGANGWEKVWWIPKDGWVYESHNTNSDDIVLSKTPRDRRVPFVFYDSLSGKSFYDGLLALVKVGGILEKQDAEFDESDRGVFVYGWNGQQKIILSDAFRDTEWGEWSNPQARISEFVYDVLNVYNQNFVAPYFFEKTTVNGAQRFLLKKEASASGNANDYVGVYMDGQDFVYYSVPMKIGGRSTFSENAYIIGSIERGTFFVSSLPSPDEIYVEGFDINGYNEIYDALRYLGGLPSKKISIK